MVYISSSALMTSMRQSIMTSQSSLAKAQTELSSGIYADVGLELGDRSGHLLMLTAQQTRLQSYTAGNTAAANRLDESAGALDSLQGTASSLLASLTSASTSAGSTSTLQGTAKAALAALTATLNTTVGGEALFGGLNTAAAPMTTYTDSPASANKTAFDQAFLDEFGFSQTSASAASITAAQMTTFLNGRAANLFSASSYGASWSTATSQTQTTQVSASQTVSSSVSANDPAFRGLAQAFTMITELTGSTIGAAAQGAVIKSALSVLSSSLTGLTDVQAGVGIAQNQITAANTRITAQTTLLTTQTSGLTETDPYDLHTRITSLETQIQAYYELTSSLRSLSLVNYLS